MSTRPNFLVIMTDDQGAFSRGDRMPELITPTLDHLAATGRDFTRFFCASPVCSPARASLLTGRMPSAHGVHDWLRGTESGIDTVGVHYLEGQSTTAMDLTTAGYRVGHAGKWHLGDARVPAPGFRDWYAHRDGGGPYYGAPVIKDGREQTEPGYITDAIGDNAAAMLRACARGPEPFYLQVDFTAPHTPWTEENHPDELLDLYRDCTFDSVPRPDRDPWANPYFDAAFADPVAALRGYCASLTGVDRAVERLVSILDETGARDDTYIIFSSDNGFSCGHRGYWGKGNGTWPLNCWDPSVLVPFYVNRPGTIEPGVDSTLTSAVSLRPTILELAGLTPPEDPLAAGTSFANRLLAPPAVEPADADPIVILDEYGGTRMIRTDAHKLIVRRDGPDELYDLHQDPGEERNLIATATATAASPSDVETTLRDRLDEWFQRRSTAEADAFTRPVTGEGQTAPVFARTSDDERYVPRPFA